MIFSSIAFLSIYIPTQVWGVEAGSAEGKQPYIPFRASGWDIEREAVELKLTEIAFNRSRNHIGERTTDNGVQVGIFLFKIRWYF